MKKLTDKERELQAKLKEKGIVIDSRFVEEE